MQVRLNLKTNLIFFKLKDKLKLRLFIKRYVINIDIAYIIRINNGHGDISVSFNIKDERMIKLDSANCLTSIVYDWLINIIQKYGKIESSDSTNQVGF